MIEEVEALPGVTRAAYISFLPMTMRGGIWPVEAEGAAADLDADRRWASLRFVTPGFFDAMQTPIVFGRDVALSDTMESPFVAVVSESFARQHWPDADPIGRQFHMAFQDRIVVGVVGDIKVRGLERESEPQVYLPSSQVPDGGIVFYAPQDLVVRASVAPVTLVPALRAIVAKADPQQPLANIQTMSDVVDAETAPRRTPRPWSRRPVSPCSSPCSAVSSPPFAPLAWTPSSPCARNSAAPAPPAKCDILYRIR